MTKKDLTYLAITLIIVGIAVFVHFTDGRGAKDVLLLESTKSYRFSSPFSSSKAGVAGTRTEVAPVIFTFDDLLDAIEWVESKGDTNAVGDNGRAVGAYQIHHCFVEDASYARKYDWHNFTDKDRLNKKECREMIRCYMSLYASYGRLGREPTFEDIARIFNGGPDGWKKKSTKAYWLKVKKRMEYLKMRIK